MGKNVKGSAGGPPGPEAAKAGKPVRNRWFLAGGIAAAVLLAAGVLLLGRRALGPAEAPEAAKILAVQAQMPFQILIPAYMPKAFDRAGVEIKVNQLGPGGEPMVELAYRTRKGSTLSVRQWVPVNPDLEVLANSRPVQTKWGKGWLLKQGESLIALWVDVGPLRASIFTTSLDILSREEVLAMAETLGPASNRQVFSFLVDRPVVAEVPPPPPVEAKVDEKGVQEITLVITPGGYNPLRFAFRKDVPARIVFRQLGQVGCGNELILPVDNTNKAAIRLDSEKDRKVYEFVPKQEGQFQFYCGHAMFRGVMTVRR